MLVQIFVEQALIQTNIYLGILLPHPQRLRTCTYHPDSNNFITSFKYPMETDPSPIKQLLTSQSEESLPATDQIVSNPQQPSKSRAIEFNNEAVRLITLKKYNQSLEYLNKGIDIIKAGKDTQTQADPLLEICLHYNLVALYEAAWSLEDCHSTCLNTLHLLNSYTDALHNPLEIIQYKLVIFKLNLQFCAVLSQLGRHNNALSLSQENKKSYLTTLKLIHERVADKLREDQTQTQGANTVWFNRRMERSVSRLQGLIDQIQTEECPSRNSIYIYNWKSNPQNNEKHTKQHFLGGVERDKDTSNRSLLGVVEDDWLENFNIGSVMHITPCKYQEFTRPIFLVEEVSNRKMEEKTLLASILFFTISTEMRLIQNIQFQVITQKSKKQKKQTKIQYSKQPQANHLKSLSLVCSNFSHSFPYMNHIINMFHKHYLQEMRKIEEKDESYINDISVSHQLSQELLEEVMQSCLDLCLEEKGREGELKVSGCETQLVGENKNCGKSTKPTSKPKYSDHERGEQDERREKRNSRGKQDIELLYRSKNKKRKSKSKLEGGMIGLKRNKSKKQGICLEGGKQAQLQPKTLASSKSTRSLKSPTKRTLLKK